MATIGNTANITLVGKQLGDVWRIIKPLGKEFDNIGTDDGLYTLTEQQLQDGVASLDVSAASAAWETAKATFLSNDPVDPPE